MGLFCHGPWNDENAILWEDALLLKVGPALKVVEVGEEKSERKVGQAQGGVFRNRTNGKSLSFG